MKTFNWNIDTTGVPTWDEPTDVRINDMDVIYEEVTSTEKMGVKDLDGKLNYELDWDFIQGMAEKMSLNKDKYEPYNWKKPMEVEFLKQSLLRHVLEIIKGNHEDDNREFGHFESVALNAMMIFYQLKAKKI